MIAQAAPYCGLPPLPADLLHRFNLDPPLILALLACSLGHLLVLPRGRERVMATAGWTIVALAFISPLCALSVSLFSARVAQHMILILLAAPLIAGAGPGPQTDQTRGPLWL